MSILGEEGDFGLFFSYKMPMDVIFLESIRHPQEMLSENNILTSTITL